MISYKTGIKVQMQTRTNETKERTRKNAKQDKENKTTYYDKQKEDKNQS